MPPEKAQQNKSNNPIMALFAELDSLITTSVKKEEVAQIVKTLIDAIKATEERITDNVASNKDSVDSDLATLQGQLTDMEQGLRASLRDMGAQNGESLGTAIKQLQEKVNEVRAQIPTLPDYTERFAEVEAKIPTIPDKDTGEDMRNALEALPDGDKLSIDAIQDLRKELKKMNQGGNGGGGGGGIVGRDLVRNYDLSDQLDGVTKTFNLPAIWSIISVATSSFPNVLRPVIDYTYTGQSITFTSEIDETTTLAAGQTVVLTIVSA